MTLKNCVVLPDEIISNDTEKVCKIWKIASLKFDNWEEFEYSVWEKNFSWVILSVENII